MFTFCYFSYLPLDEQQRGQPGSNVRMREGITDIKMVAVEDIKDTIFLERQWDVQRLKYGNACNDCLAENMQKIKETASARLIEFLEYCFL